MLNFLKIAVSESLNEYNIDLKQWIVVADIAADVNKVMFVILKHNEKNNIHGVTDIAQSKERRQLCSIEVAA